MFKNSMMQKIEQQIVAYESSLLYFNVNNDFY